MTFTNIAVDIEELPAATGVTVAPVDPRHARISMWISAIVFIVVTIAALVLAFVVDPVAQPFFAVATVIVAMIGVIATWYTLVYCRKIGYALRTHDLVLHRGVFFFSQTVQPLARVQHVELKRGPLEKRYGLASLKVFSAGHGKETFTLPGLQVEDAERIRGHVLGYKG